ncbi:MAG: hypothetical protein FWD14_03350 [Treponema sp.]|nr:hypothetical protein [Treponema sp.]
MNQESWNGFKKSRKHFQNIVDKLSRDLPYLKDIQQEFADKRSEKSYTVETPVVYNTALDDITINSEIKLILVADNPGRREQAKENRRYLIGPSGKIAQKFFRDNPALGIDFSKNVLILNKTPVHSPRTIELRELCRMDKVQLFEALNKSQIDMASLLYDFHEALNCPVWITGYSEMKKGGIFEVYTEKIKELYGKNREKNKQLFLYRHFSMNQFTIDLKKQALAEETAAKTLKRIGSVYRKRILDL